MSKEEMKKEWLENMLGREIVDCKIEPKFDSHGNIISYDIMVQPKASLKNIEIPITILPTSSLNQNKDE